MSGTCFFRLSSQLIICEMILLDDDEDDEGDGAPGEWVPLSSQFFGSEFNGVSLLVMDNGCEITKLSCECFAIDDADAKN